MSIFSYQVKDFRHREKLEPKKEAKFSHFPGFSLKKCVSSNRLEMQID